MRDTAIKAARQAGEFLKNSFGTLLPDDFKLKGERDIVTEYDARAEEMIVDEVKKKFPDHNIFGEESGQDQKDSEYTWIIDPLDGTTNFAIGAPLFDVSIGVARGVEPVLAVVYTPMRDYMYVAEKDKGATCNDQPIHVSKISELQKALTVYCHDYTDKGIEKMLKIFASVKPQVRDLTRMRAAALELALVASGYVESYHANGLHPWDVAAGALLVKEAGGNVTDFDGKDWNLNSPDIIASNGKIHSQLLEKIQSAFNNE